MSSARKYGGMQSWTTMASIMFAASVFLFSSIAQGQRGGLSAEKIYNEVSKSVAKIDDLGSHGSGVVLTEGGQILTNYHVVASGLPLSVTVMVQDGRGGAVAKTFEDVKWSKVHTEYDLALIQIDLKGDKCFAAKKLKAGSSVQTGAVCYAIGNPGGADGKALVNSITEGLVSAANREVEGLDYIQISAALNPGNSGGAVCDANGNVFGVATWKIDQSDNIGFAIPINTLSLEDFGELAERKPDPETAKLYEQEGHRFAEMAERMVGDDRELAMLYAAFMYRKCIESIPGHPSPYHNVGVMYYRMKEDTLAQAYFERAIKLKPLYAPSMGLLGIVYQRLGADLARSEELWFKGTTDTENLDDASDCAEHLSVSYIRKEEKAAAAYCSKWADSLGKTSPERAKVRAQIFEESIQVLNKAQYSFIKGDDIVFSREGLEEFVKLEGDGGGEMPKPQENEKAPVDIVSTGNYAEIAQKMAEKGIEIPEEGISKPLPVKPGKAIMGYAGTCLLIDLPELKKIAVFDLCQAKITNYIDTGSMNYLFAAGGQVLLILDTDTNFAKVWDMETWKKRNEFEIRTTRKIASIGMGLMRHDFAMVTHTEGGGAEWDKVAILSIPSGKIEIPEVVQSEVGMSLHHLYGHMGDRAQVFVEENGRSAVVTGSGRGLFDLTDLSKTEASYFHTGGTQTLQPSLGGAFVIDAKGAAYAKNGEDDLVQEYDKSRDLEFRHYGAANIFGYRGFLQMSQDDKRKSWLSVRALPQLNKVAKVSLDDEIFDMWRHNSNKNSFFASAYVKRCAIVDEEGKSVFILPLLLGDPAASEEFGEDGSFVRKLNFEEGTTVAIEDAPEGLSYDPETGELSWAVPDEQESGSEVPVILLLKDKDGVESYHIEKILIP